MAPKHHRPHALGMRTWSCAQIRPLPRRATAPRPRPAVIRFLEPWWLLAALPVLSAAAAYGWRQWRRKALAVRLSNAELLRAVAPHGWGWRRHWSATALLLCILALAAAMARPFVDVKMPVERATVILAIDVSLSMKATDVKPTRIEAAQEAAKTFVKELPTSYNLGLVSFSDAAKVLVSPSKERDIVTGAIDALQLGEATATGEAVFTSLAAIAGIPPDGATGPPPAMILLL